MVVGTGCERGGDGVFPVRVVTSAFPSSDIDSLTCDEVRLRVCADPGVSLAPFAGPTEVRLDTSDEGGRRFLLSSWITKEALRRFAR